MITVRFKRRKLWLVTIAWEGIIAATAVTLMTILYVDRWLLVHWWTYGVTILGWALLLIRFNSFEPGTTPIFRDYILPFIPITRFVRRVSWNEKDADFGPNPIVFLHERRWRWSDGEYQLRCPRPRETFEWLRDNIFTPSATVVMKTDDQPPSAGSIPDRNL